MGGKRLNPAWIAAVALAAAGTALGCPYGVATARLIKSDVAVHPGLKPAKPAQVNTGDEPGDLNSGNPDVNAPAAVHAGTSRPGGYGRSTGAVEGASRSPARIHGADKASLGMHPAGRDRSSAQDGNPMSVTPDTLVSADVGLKVRALNGDERRDFGVPEGGLVVTGVSGENAQHAGFRAGDVLLTLDGVAVRDPSQFHQLILQLPHDRPVPVLVRRPNSNLFLPLDAPHR